MDRLTHERRDLYFMYMNMTQYINACLNARRTIVKCYIGSRTSVLS